MSLAGERDQREVTRVSITYIYLELPQLPSTFALQRLHLEMDPEPVLALSPRLILSFSGDKKGVIIL